MASRMPNTASCQGLGRQTCSRHALNAVLAAMAHASCTCMGREVLGWQPIQAFTPGDDQRNNRRVEKKTRQRGPQQAGQNLVVQGLREYAAKLETFQSAKCVRLMLPRHLLAGLFVRVSNMAAVGSKGIVQGPLLRRSLAQPRLARAFVACSGERPAASPFAVGRLMHTSQQLAAARGRPVTTGAAAVSALPRPKSPKTAAGCCLLVVPAERCEGSRSGVCLEQPGVLVRLSAVRFAFSCTL